MKYERREGPTRFLSPVDDVSQFHSLLDLSFDLDLDPLITHHLSRTQPPTHKAQLALAWEPCLLVTTNAHTTNHDTVHDG